MRQINKILSIIAVLIFSATISFAAETTPAEKVPDYNMALISLVSLILVLVFVIGMMANTLKQLGRVVADKKHKDRLNAGSASKVLLLILAVSMPGAHLFAATEAAAAPAVEYIQGIPSTDFYVIIGIIGVELLVVFMLAAFIHMLLRAMMQQPELKVQAAEIARKSWFWDKFNAAATIEQEKDILLDHNYDGIQELDNSLPPWWKYGFYLTIFVGIIYFYRFQISHDGASQQEEYAAEMQQGEEDKAAYLAKSANNVDESNVTALTDAGEIAAGREMFVKTCAACHVADGGGNVGPNLTDEYWLHGGGIKDVFKSIKYGWQDKGMKSWKDDYSPKQIQELASFVKSLKGSHPAAPKAAQGEVYIEAAPQAADSTQKAAPKTNGVAVK